MLLWVQEGGGGSQAAADRRVVREGSGKAVRVGCRAALRLKFLSSLGGAFWKR